MSIITLSEYETRLLSPDILPYEVGLRLWQQYDQRGRRLQIGFPSPKTQGWWQITTQGWVGQIPLTPDTQLHIEPRVAWANLFGMWATAYGLRHVPFLDGLTAVHSLPGFYDHLASVLAQQVLRLVRQGLPAAYVAQTAVRPYVRGELRLAQTHSHNPTAGVVCRATDPTYDHEDNQILAYTLGQIARLGLCTPPVQEQVRRAYHTLTQVVSIRPFTPADCQHRTYTRLTHAYGPLHALCRFFLEHTAPFTAVGSHKLAPFLLSMPQLYERFVANWLTAHLPPAWRLRVQESVPLGAEAAVRFHIDLVLYDQNGLAHAVLDTKYKTADKPETADVSQIIAYAQAKNCPRALLIYPQPLAQSLNAQIYNLHVRSLTFALQGNLENNGHTLLTELLADPAVR